MAAARDGDFGEVAALLKRGADPNGFRSDAIDQTIVDPRETPIFFAVSNGRLDVVRNLVDSGADLHAGGLEASLLQRAIQGRDLKMFEQLLKPGVDFGLINDRGETAMDIAADRANKRLVALLKAHGAPYTIQEAAALGDLRMVKQLVAENRSRLKKRCFCGNSPLGVALSKGHSEVARYLIAQGASLDHHNENGESLLHLAARGNCADWVAFLLDKGLDVNERDGSGETPLHETTFTDCAGAAEVLIKRGADINARNSSGITPTFWCASYDSPNVLKLLLDAGVDPNEPAVSQESVDSDPQFENEKNTNPEAEGHFR